MLLQPSPIREDEVGSYGVSRVMDEESHKFTGVGLIIYVSSEEAAKRLYEWLDSGDISITVKEMVE